MGQGNDEGRKVGRKERWQDGSKERKDDVLEEDTKIWAKVMMKDGRTDGRKDDRTEAKKGSKEGRKHESTKARKEAM
jgi:hypothetical protein